MNSPTKTTSARAPLTFDEQEFNSDERRVVLELDSWSLCVIGAWLLIVAFLVAQQVAKAIVVGS